MQDIKWVPVPGFWGYFISDQGVVSELTPRGRKLLRAGRNTSGHMTVTLYDAHRKPFKRYIHRLVLLAFVGEPAPGHIACHADDDPANNRLSNLRWDTHAANFADALRNGRFDRFLAQHERATTA